MCVKHKVDTMSELSFLMMNSFKKINADWFDGELESVIITFEGGFKKGAYGWITTIKDWKQNGEERYNINISSDFLSRPIYDIIGTLVHEMCHLYNIQHNIQDCSRSGNYHNTRFRDSALAHGLTCEKVDKTGWSRTAVTDEMKKYIDEKIPFSSVNIHKMIINQVKDKPKTSTRKYICPVCGLIVRATKDCRISCMECNEGMLLK